jgi:hypothetical protein
MNPRATTSRVFESVRRFALSLEAVVEGTSYGTPAFKVNGKLFARLRPDLDSLVLRMDFPERAKLIAANPDTYYITDHYLNYPWLLVRLSIAEPKTLRALVRKAQEAAASTEQRSSRSDARFVRQMQPKTSVKIGRTK